jgi:hypothetical protein
MDKDLTVENVVYTSPFNPEPLNIVSRNTVTHKENTVTLKTKPQCWFSGIHELNEVISLPAGLTAGNYQLFISLSAASDLLFHQAAYSIQMANDNRWE